VSAAAFDYDSLQVTAQGLINRFGRPATLTRAERLTVEDPAKPWLPIQGDPAAAPAQAITLQCVFLSLDRTDRDGQVVEAKTQTVLAGAESTLPEEVGPDWTLVDGDRTWELVSSRPLKPGPVLMIYKLELAL
jgi:hypothetical protein